MVLSYLAGDPSALRLRRAARGGLSEFTYSKTLNRYAAYLEQRITSFKELGYDLTQAGRRDRFERLRKQSASKGLLRDLAVIQRTMNSMLACSVGRTTHQFFVEERQDELTMSALQMTLKDMLAHYMGMNEGIINMLQHYFTMSRREAERSLELYKQFCWQTEKVVAFLNASKRLSSSLRAAIPSLDHAPLELAGALEEYLADPDFDANRNAYLHSRDKNGATARTKPANASSQPAKSAQPDASASTAKTGVAPAPSAPTPGSNHQVLQDFFASLEPQNETPFQAVYPNPSAGPQAEWYHGPMPTGPVGMPAQPTGPMSMVAQPTGFNPYAPMPMQPQMTAYAPFQANGMQPMMTGMPSAPLAPQHTMQTSPFENIFGQMAIAHRMEPRQPGPLPVPQRQASMPMPERQLSTPLAPGPSEAKPAPRSNDSIPPLKSHKTGTMNPFSIPSDFAEPAPAVAQPKQPTLNEISSQAWLGQSMLRKEPESHEPARTTLQPQSTGWMGSVASEFARPSASATGGSGPEPFPEKRATQPTTEPFRGHAFSPSSTGQSAGQTFGPQPTGSAFGPQPTGAAWPGQGASHSLIGHNFTAQPTGQPFAGHSTGERGPAAGQSGAPGSLFSPQPTGQPFAPQYTGQPGQSLTAQPTARPFPTPSASQPSSQQAGQPFGAQATGQYGQYRQSLTGQPTGQPFGTQATGQYGQPFASQPTGQPFGAQATGQYGQPFASQPMGQPFSAQQTGQPGQSLAGQPTSQPTGGPFSHNPLSLSMEPSHHAYGRTTQPGQPSSHGLGISADAHTASQGQAGGQATSPSISNLGLQGLSAQPTGLAGIKPFQPTSSFGHSLLQQGAAPPPSTAPDLLQF